MPDWMKTAAEVADDDRSARIAVIKAEAHRRIVEKYPMWKQINAMLSGGDDQMIEEIKAIRDASDMLEADASLDHADDGNWPKILAGSAKVGKS